MAVTANPRGAAKGQRQWNRAVLAAEKRDVLACRGVSLLKMTVSLLTQFGEGENTEALLMPVVHAANRPR